MGIIRGVFNLSISLPVLFLNSSQIHTLISITTFSKSQSSPAWNNYSSLPIALHSIHFDMPPNESPHWVQNDFSPSLPPSLPLSASCWFCYSGEPWRIYCSLHLLGHSYEQFIKSLPSCLIQNPKSSCKYILIWWLHWLPIVIGWTIALPKMSTP